MILRAFRDIGLGYSFADRLAILWLTRARQGAYWPMPHDQILISLKDQRNEYPKFLQDMEEGEIR